MRARLGAAADLCEVIVLKLRTQGRDRSGVERRGIARAAIAARLQDCVISWGVITHQCYQLLSASQLITTDNSGESPAGLGIRVQGVGG